MLSQKVARPGELGVGSAVCDAWVPLEDPALIREA